MGKLFGMGKKESSYEFINNFELKSFFTFMMYIFF